MMTRMMMNAPTRSDNIAFFGMVALCLQHGEVTMTAVILFFVSVYYTFKHFGG